MRRTARIFTATALAFGVLAGAGATPAVASETQPAAAQAADAVPSALALAVVAADPASTLKPTYRTDGSIAGWTYCTITAGPSAPYRVQEGVPPNYNYGVRGWAETRCDPSAPSNEEQRTYVQRRSVGGSTWSNQDGYSVERVPAIFIRDWHDDDYCPTQRYYYRSYGKTTVIGGVPREVITDSSPETSLTC